MWPFAQHGTCATATSEAMTSRETVGGSAQIRHAREGSPTSLDLLCQSRAFAVQCSAASHGESESPGSAGDSSAAIEIHIADECIFAATALLRDRSFLASRRQFDTPRAALLARWHPALLPRIELVRDGAAGLCCEPPPPPTFQPERCAMRCTPRYPHVGDRLCSRNRSCE